MLSLFGLKSDTPLTMTGYFGCHCSLSSLSWRLLRTDGRPARCNVWGAAGDVKGIKSGGSKEEKRGNYTLHETYAH